jgi:hypothetical protein
MPPHAIKSKALAVLVSFAENASLEFSESARWYKVI